MGFGRRRLEQGLARHWHHQRCPSAPPVRCSGSQRAPRAGEPDREPGSETAVSARSPNEQWGSPVPGPNPEHIVVPEWTRLRGCVCTHRCVAAVRPKSGVDPSSSGTSRRLQPGARALASSQRHCRWRSGGSHSWSVVHRPASHASVRIARRSSSRSVISEFSDIAPHRTGRNPRVREPSRIR